MKKENPNNKVKVVGTIYSEITYKFRTEREVFYEAKISTLRDSGVADVIPIVIPESLLDFNSLYKGCRDKKIEIQGEYRSRNDWVEGRSHLYLYIFVNTIQFVNEETEDVNEITIKGYFGVSPKVRITPMSHRTIADFLVAVHRSNRRSDYLPCIAWNSDARKIESYPEGTYIECIGRIQSREYWKFYPEAPEKSETKIAYEVSIRKIELIKN